MSPIPGRNTSCCGNICFSRTSQGALDCCGELSSSVLRAQKLPPQELFQGHYRAGTTPEERALKLFGEFRFLDEGEVHRLAAPEPLFTYLFHPNRLREDFLASRWKTGFLKQMFQLKLSYETLYHLLRRMK